jgi:hypothetical protein
MVRLFVIAALSIAAAACSDSVDNQPAKKTGLASPAGANETAPSADCLKPDALRQYGRLFVDKVDWERLPILKDWTMVLTERSRGEGRQKAAGAVNAFNLGPERTYGSLGWHETSEVCVQQRGGEFWARLLDGNPEKPPQWEGPFVPLPDATDYERAYFNRLFGKACYEDDEGQPWCFSDGALQIATKRYAAGLHLDSSEMPNYGSPVKLEKQEGFLMFVPAGSGWKVFKDNFVTLEGRVEVDPRRDPPWRELKPKLTQ